MIPPMPVGIKTNMLVFSSNKYKKIMICEKARQATVDEEIPSIVFLPRQKDMSFLNAKKSNST